MTDLLGENVRTILFYVLQTTLWDNPFPLLIISNSTMVVVNLIQQYLHIY